MNLIAREKRKGLSRNERLYVCALYAEQNTCSRIDGLLNLHIFGCCCIEMASPFNAMLFHVITVLAGRTRCVILRIDAAS